MMDRIPRNSKCHALQAIRILMSRHADEKYDSDTVITG